MAFFLPSSIQKRLLRYALSRVQLFDTDALELDNLDIAFGRRSNIELRNVALRKCELAKLLSLPPAVTVQSAAVSSLRLVVPADVYSSSIQIHLAGVNVDFQVDPPTDVDADRVHTSAESEQVQRNNQAQREALNHAEDHPQPDPVIPSPGDLAKSFLKSEPADRTTQLNAELLSQSVDFRNAVDSNISQESPGYGTGGDAALPGFLTGFLKGVVDRLEINVKDVAVRVHTHIQPPKNTPDAHANPSVPLIPFVLACRINGAELEGVSRSAQVEQSNPRQAEEACSPALRRRAVRIHNVKASIHCRHRDMVLFQNNATHNHNSEAQNAGDSVSNLGSSRPSNISTSPPDSTHKVRPETGQEQYAGNNSNAYFDDYHRYPSPIHYPSIDAQVENFGSSTISHTSSQRREEQDTHSLSSSPACNVQESLETFCQERRSLDFRRLRRSRRSSFASSISTEENPFEPLPTTSFTGDPPCADTLYLNTESTPEASLPTIQAEKDESMGQGGLTESMVFSHDQAASMYASALHGEAMEQPNHRVFPRMPGAWNDQPSSGFQDSVPSNSFRQLAESNTPQTPPPVTSGAMPRTNNAFAGVQPLLDLHGTTSSSANPHENHQLDDLVSMAKRSDEDYIEKPIFEAQDLQFWLPNQVSSSDLAGSESVIPDEPDHTVMQAKSGTGIPGSFSTYAESVNIARSQVNGIRPTATPDVAGQAGKRSERNMLDVDIHLRELHSAVSLNDLTLLTQAVRRLFAFTTASGIPSRPSQNAENASPAKQTNNSLIQVHAVLNAVSLAITQTDGKVPNPGDSGPSATAGQGNLAAFNCSHTSLDLALYANEITRLEFGIRDAEMDLGNQPILRFNSEARMASSVKDTQILDGRVFSLSYSVHDNQADLSLSTLPVAVELDATTLDNTLSSIGGFNTLLEMGSSVLSETALEEPQKVPNPPTRSHVHFKQESHSPDEAEKVDRKPSTKFNARINGLSVKLCAGGRCLQYNSTAIKTVIRHGVAGVQIDDSRLIGPYHSDVDRKHSSSVRARNLNFRFLHRPEERDLTRLISLVTPSKDNFERGDGGLMVETLVRQRKSGTAARISLSSLELQVSSVAVLDELKAFANDIVRLGSISRYLPEETRPGLLTLASVDRVVIHSAKTPVIGDVTCHITGLEVANVSLPSLLGSKIRAFHIWGRNSHELIHAALPPAYSEHDAMLALRLVGEEVVPRIEVTIMNICLEYDVEVFMEIFGIANSPHGVDALAASIADLAADTGSTATQTQAFPPRLENNSSSSSMTSLKVDVGVKNCDLCLVPRGVPSKALFVFTDARVQFTLGKMDFSVTDVELRKAALLLTNDRASLTLLNPAESSIALKKGQQIPILCSQGYVSVCWISAARAVIDIQSNGPENIIDINFEDQLFVLETCADSTKTLAELFSALQPPVSHSTGSKFQTEVTTVEDMMASFVGESLPVQRHSVEHDDYKGELASTPRSEAEYQNLGSRSHTLSSRPGSSVDSSLSEINADFGTGTGTGTGIAGAGLDLNSTGLEPTALPDQNHGTAAKWDSDRNRYIAVSRSEVLASPFKLHVENIHVIWNLHDGYDWEKTRETITAAVDDLEAKSEEKRQSRRPWYQDEFEPEPVIGDFLFNSIYVGVPINQDMRNVERRINRNLDEDISETISHVTTETEATGRTRRSPKPRSKKLKLTRSQRHNITFELNGVSADMFLFAPGQETISSTNISIQDFEIFDHVPTSTWKKFMTYMQDAGPREDKKPMMHFEICNVKPVPDLLASELVMRVTVLPVRLHVDQDALDFITRFFAFEDGEHKGEEKPADQPYIQRVEVLSVPIRLDYKPKKVDFVGLRSGRTKEFMNFFNLDSANMVLRHAIIYGCPSFARLHSNLEDIWMPDITTKQLPSVLSGLNGVRTLVNVGSGVRNLVTIPVQEYRKDGRVFRGISKGALSFARTSGSELTKFGAKLAIGAQSALQGAEDFLVKPRETSDFEWEDADLQEEEKRAFSHYAAHPAGILQGVKGAAKSLERDLLMTRDVIVAISGEARESGSIEGTARAVARHAPTIILRPMIGASKAVSQTLMGATNAVDPSNKRRIEDKYKRY
ncbi:MAG: hypothetical protein Q9159_003479 [Coniocarpon cinnabarinum]